LPVTTNKASLIAEADKCVLCGMCLPHCPTYSLAQNENESPRGRLVLGKAYLAGLVEQTSDLVEHIDHCLLCRNCENCCPSGVLFGTFMDGLRSNLPQKKPQHDFAEILSNQQQRRSLNKKLWLGQKSGVLSASKLFIGGDNKRLLDSLPTLQRFKELNNHYPANDDELAKVMLFTGCHSELLGNSLVVTAIELLTRLGVSIEIPSQQACCGGLSRHHGDADKANQLETENIAAFSHEPDIPILTLASGCGASLLDYSDNAATSFTARVIDITAFLVSHLHAIKPNLAPCHKKVVIQTPCSMKNRMHTDKAIPALLKTIPELDVSDLNGQRGCCGAAGTYMYEQAESADALREPIIDDLIKKQADILVTSNIGCAMHIQSGMKQAGLTLDILHPIELVARQLIS